MLTLIGFGFILGVLWHAMDQWDKCFGVEGFIFRVIVIGSWGSLAGYVGWLFLLTMSEDGVSQIAILLGLLTCMFGSLPVLVVYDTIEGWWYHNFPKELT